MTDGTTRRQFLKRSTLAGIGLSIAAAPAWGDSPGEKSNSATAGSPLLERLPANRPGQAVDGNPATWWEASDSARTAWLEMDLGQEVEFDRLALREAISQGQAIAAFRVLAKRGGGWEQVCAGGTVGRQRIALFRPLRASCVRVELTTNGRPATLREIGLYRGQE